MIPEAKHRSDAVTFQLTIRDIRSFNGLQTVTFRPITLVVGDNSSGKTTLLALARATLAPYSFPMAVNFTEPPFDLGGFTNIATRRVGPKGSAKSFALGISVPSDSSSIAIIGEYERGQYEQPIPRKLDISNGRFRIVIDCKRRPVRATGVIDDEIVAIADATVPESFAHMSHYALWHQPMFALSHQLQSDETEPRKQFRMFIDRLANSPGVPVTRQTISIAPVRSEPKRTYDRFAPPRDPTGKHVPMLLAKLFEGQSAQVQPSTAERLVNFGTDAGLFQDIAVRSLGRKGSDPFQILVKKGTISINLADVGYGVSQSLPIAVESIVANKGSRLLLQQPEVHLHPKAQAALGSLFATLYNEDKKELIVETHSDYIIDRLRLHVAKGEVKADDVQILYLHNQKGKTVVHHIGLDSDGNVIHAPGEYREFFLSEQERLFMRK